MFVPFLVGSLLKPLCSSVFTRMQLNFCVKDTVFTNLGVFVPFFLCPCISSCSIIIIVVYSQSFSTRWFWSWYTRWGYLLKPGGSCSVSWANLFAHSVLYKRTLFCIFFTEWILGKLLWGTSLLHVYGDVIGFINMLDYCDCGFNIGTTAKLEYSIIM